MFHTQQRWIYDSGESGALTFCSTVVIWYSHQKMSAWTCTVKGQKWYVSHVLHKQTNFCVALKVQQEKPFVFHLYSSSESEVGGCRKGSEGDLSQPVQVMKGHARTHTQTLVSSNIFVILLSSVNDAQFQGPPPRGWRHIRGQSSPAVITANWSKTITQHGLSANYSDKKGRERRKEPFCLHACAGYT